MNANPQTCRMPSPLGEILLVANARGDALRGLYLEGQKYFPEDAALWTASPRLPLFRDAVAQLGEYFAGGRENFAIPLEPAGTAFQRAVWREIARVPYGGMISYAALGRNPITVVIPCHRIVGSGGALTGYAGGLDRKRALLAIEARSGRPAR